MYEDYFNVMAFLHGKARLEYAGKSSHFLHISDLKICLANLPSNYSASGDFMDPSKL